MTEQIETKALTSVPHLVEQGDTYTTIVDMGTIWLLQTSKV